jgi:hypothetical protein
VRPIALLAALLLAGCSAHQDSADASTESAGARLEQAAITTGVISDPASADLTGVYARDPERACVVPAAAGFRIGITLDYGRGQQCSARGSLVRDGDVLKIDLGNGCAFDARFDGQGISFPGALPAGCDTVCTGRASLEGVAVDRLSDSLSEAESVGDSQGHLLCTATN